MLSFFPLDVLDKNWDLIESVSEGFLAYSFVMVHCVSLDWLLFKTLISIFFFKVFFFLNKSHVSKIPLYVLARLFSKKTSRFHSSGGGVGGVVVGVMRKL